MGWGGGGWGVGAGVGGGGRGGAGSHLGIISIIWESFGSKVLIFIVLYAFFDKKVDFD